LPGDAKNRFKLRPDLLSTDVGVLRHRQSEKAS
jgi:hypothetical protein